MKYDTQCTICDRIISDKEMEKAFEVSRGVYRLEDGSMHFISHFKPESEKGETLSKEN
jgi:hypothetical protein